MIHRTAHFIVQHGKVEEALELITTFVEEVNSKEDGCKLYRCLQNSMIEQEFLHYMIFEDKSAEDHHRSTPYVKEFVEKLYPLLEQQTEFTTYQHIAG